MQPEVSVPSSRMEGDSRSNLCKIIKSVFGCKHTQSVFQFETCTGFFTVHNPPHRESANNSMAPSEAFESRHWNQQNVSMATGNLRDMGIAPALQVTALDTEKASPTPMPKDAVRSMKLGIPVLTPTVEVRVDDFVTELLVVTLSVLAHARQKNSCPSTGSGFPTGNPLPSTQSNDLPSVLQ